MAIQLSDHFTYRRLLQFTMPSIIMMIIMSIYSVVDGFFVSNLVGSMALSAVNIVYPISMIIGAIGFMLGTGGSAVVAVAFGQGKKELGNQYFSMFIYAVILLGAVFSIICIIFMEPLARMAGASEALMRDSVVYGKILLAGSVPFMLQNTFQCFFVVAEKPQLGLWFSVAAGITNMVLDYVFIKVFQMGVAGAGLATIIGYIVGGVIPFFYFLWNKKGKLKLVKCRFYGRVFLKACNNGISEMMNTIASSVVCILYNIQLMRLVGENGVVAYSVMLYADFIFLGTFLGFSIGSAPVISYHYGAENESELKNVFKKSLIIIGGLAVIMVTAAELLSHPISAIFVGYDEKILEMTVHGFRLFALNYAVCGINVYSSAFFTALCNGKISAFLSFMRSFVLRCGMLYLLAEIWGLDGIWLAVVAAEGIGAVISAGFFLAKRKQYHYA